MAKQGKIVERELPAEAEFGRDLLALKLSDPNFFNVDKDGKPFGELLKIERLTEQNNKSLPYNLEDLDHQAKLFLKEWNVPARSFNHGVWGRTSIPAHARTRGIHCDRSEGDGKRKSREMNLGAPPYRGRVAGFTTCQAASSQSAYADSTRPSSKLT